MRLRFSSEARDDLYGAVNYYERQEPGLGQRLRHEVSEILRTISSSPYLWRERLPGYRRVNLPVFPFYLAYVIRDGSVVILALAHEKREPGFWIKRLP